MAHGDHCDLSWCWTAQRNCCCYSTAKLRYQWQKTNTAQHYFVSNDTHKRRVNNCILNSVQVLQRHFSDITFTTGLFVCVYLPRTARGTSQKLLFNMSICRQITNMYEYFVPALNHKTPQILVSVVAIFPNGSLLKLVWSRSNTIKSCFWFKTAWKYLKKITQKKKKLWLWAKKAHRLAN